MGHQTVHHVRRASRYEQALAVYKGITPIRGQVPERRPLGQRRDHQTYWVRTRATNPNAPTTATATATVTPDQPIVEFMVYRTPVLTFYPDNSIEVRNGGYPSVTTHTFIEQVLSGLVSASGYRDSTKLTVYDQVMLLGRDKDKDCVRLIRNAEDRLVFADEVPEQYQPMMNRKAANNVRRKYKGFVDYMKGMLALRSEDVQRNIYGYDYSTGQRTTQTVYDKKVRVTHDEVLEVLGYTPTGVEYPMRVTVNNLLDALVNLDIKYYPRFNKTDREDQIEKLKAWVNPEQDEETRIENYHRALIALMVGDRVQHLLVRLMGVSDMANPYFFEEAETVMKRFDRAILYAHADEVLELTKLPPGKLPNHRYADWPMKKGESE